MLATIKNHYYRQMMFPGLLGLLVNPFYFARRGLLLAMRDFAVPIRGRMLDVGCGTRPYESLFNVSVYIGLELDTPENRQYKPADLFYDGKTFPVETGSFDVVLCNQVLEHVFEPDAFLCEIGRALRRDGHLLLTVPFAWDEHEQPRDYARYSSFGLTALLARNGFEVIELRKTVTDIRTIFQLLNTYLFKKTLTRNAYINLGCTLVLMAPFNIIGTIMHWITPRNADLYLDNVVLAKKVART